MSGSDPQELKDKYGEKICFFGGIDQQSLLPSGDLKKIRAEIRERISYPWKGQGISACSGSYTSAGCIS